mgnify:CR=1 FL=1
MQDWNQLRERMVETLIRYGIRDRAILDAMGSVPRHRFIPESHRSRDAYGDHPCPIGNGQTISQPYIVAYMTELLQLAPRHRVMEIGTGSAYQTAVLAEIAEHVYTVETVPELHRHATHILPDMGYDNVSVRLGDGYEGWPEEAPFDRIVVTCAPPTVPDSLTAQLADGGRMVLPVGAYSQRLVVVTRESGRISTSDDLPVAFVPMVPPG